jgi:hypothetical protein
MTADALRTVRLKVEMHMKNIYLKMQAPSESNPPSNAGWN